MLPLIERLDLIQSARNALRTRHLLIEAAAGYGKTELLNQLVVHLPHATRVQLTVDDNDIAVLRRRIDRVIDNLLLIDDVHVLEPASESSQWLQQQLIEAPHAFVVAGRSLPFDQLELLLRDKAVRWDDATMRFSTELVTELLPQAEPEWKERAAGWPMAVALLQRLSELGYRADAAQVKLFNQLTDLLFDGLPPTLQTFMLCTAAPMGFSVELAAQLLDVEVVDAAALLSDVQARNLFVQAGDATGTFQYHALVQSFLRARDPILMQQMQLTAAAWHVQRHETVAAIDHYLLAGAHETALAVMAQAQSSLLEEASRTLTYRRWLQAIDPNLYSGQIELILAYVGRMHYDTRYHQEAVAMLETLREQPDLSEAEQLRIAVQQANFLRVTHQHEAALDVLQPMLRQGHLPPETSYIASQIAAISSAELLRPTQAKRYFGIAVRAAEALSPERVRNARNNMAQSALAYLGEYAATFAIIDATIAAEETPFWQLRYLMQGSMIASRCGDVERLRAYLRQARTVAATLEHVIDSDRRFLQTYELWLTALSGRPLGPAPQPDIWTQDDDSAQIWGLNLAFNLARLYEDEARIDELLADAAAASHTLELHGFERAFLALEVDVAKGLIWLSNPAAAFALSPMTRRLITARSRGELVRLQALLAVVCWTAGDASWRKRARQALRRHAWPGYDRLLTTRDPALGKAFWRMLLIEGVERELAKESLIAIGAGAPLIPLLRHEQATLRQQAAEILQAIGDEAALPAIDAALKVETAAEVKAALRTAQHKLESQPPPPLEIRLCGRFVVQRGAEVVESFHRPVVARLLQYFALHRGQPVPKDQILEALWPDAPPRKALTTFRTVYSRLRTTLEPYVRKNGPNRYFLLDGENYLFDPDGYVTVDSEQFATIVALALTQPQRLSDATIALLLQYEPLLTEQPYADWLLEPRERLQTLYLDACLRAGQEQLARGHAPEAQQWAQRVIAQAPWLEAAYQLLMRAYARQNLRSRALVTFTEAQSALKRELAVEPAPLTLWLYQRLQAGEQI